MPAKSLKLLGATHAAELPLVFGRLTGFENGACNLTANEGQLSKQLVEAWTAMASKADPSSGGLQWPEFSVQKSAGVVINETVEVGEVDYSVCEFWDEIDALSVRLGTVAGAGNFSANGTSKTSGGSATGTVGATGSATSPIAFTGAATEKIAGNVLSLAVVTVAVVEMLMLL